MHAVLASGALVWLTVSPGDLVWERQWFGQTRVAPADFILLIYKSYKMCCRRVPKIV
jgi:hypothetical protein